MKKKFEHIKTEKGSRPVLPESYRNICIELSYDGSKYQGYQIQTLQIKTVQLILEQAWQIMTKEDPTFYGCSRLDAGVMAYHFVANIYTQYNENVNQIIKTLNGILHSNLHESICIYSVIEKDAKFHARYDTIGKHYRYLLWYGSAMHYFFYPISWHLIRKNKPENIDKILPNFVGTHNFKAFRATDCTAQTTIRTIHHIDFWQHYHFRELYIIDVWGDGFLKNMIRNIIGTTIDISTNNLDLTNLNLAFEMGDRKLAGQCAPAKGLALMKVYYDELEYYTDIKNNKRILF